MRIRLRHALWALLLASLASPAAAAPKPAPADEAEPAEGGSAAESAPPADAKDKDKDGKEAAAEEEPVAPASPEIFEQALKLHYAGKSKEAAPLFYTFLKGSPRTADNYNWAEFFLAEDLAQLGFTHAAIVYHASAAKNRSQAEVLPEALAALERLSALGPYDAELVDREVVYGTNFGVVPPKAYDYVHFTKGVLAYKDGYLRWAWGHFDKLKPATRYQAKARLLRALHQLDSESAPEKALEAFASIAEDPKADREVKNDARIAAARLLYERGEFEKAEKYYDSVELPELDPGRGQIYLEKAWTRYRRGEASRAMGLLLALDAPSYRELFLPEKYILASLIFKDRCHYLPAKRAARGFLRRFHGALQLIKDRGALGDDPRLVSAALQMDGSVRRAGEFVERLTLERDRIDDYAGRFEASGLTRMLRPLYDRALDEAVRRREALLARALVDAADALLRTEEQVRLLDYEIGLDLYKRVKKGVFERTLEKEEPLGETDVLYWFDGEYWNDELMDYRLMLPSRCAAAEADK